VYRRKRASAGSQRDGSASGYRGPNFKDSRARASQRRFVGRAPLARFGLASDLGAAIGGDGSGGEAIPKRHRLPPLATVRPAAANGTASSWSRRHRFGGFGREAGRASREDAFGRPGRRGDAAWLTDWVRPAQRQRSDLEWKWPVAVATGPGPASVASERGGSGGPKRRRRRRPGQGPKQNAIATGFPAGAEQQQRAMPATATG